MKKRIICPSCGSVEVKYDKKIHMFHCSYCQTKFSLKQVNAIKNEESQHRFLFAIGGGAIVIVVGIVIVGSFLLLNKESASTVIEDVKTNQVTLVPEPTLSITSDIDESESDVWINVLQDVFQTSYGEITQEQINTIKFLGFYRKCYDNIVRIQIGKKDFFEYDQTEDFSNTVKTYELKYIDNEFYEAACTKLSMFQGITVLETDYSKLNEELLSCYPNLKGLATIGCANPYFLANFTNLKQLYLESVPIREYLAALTNLTSLTLVNCELDKFTSWMTKFSQLKQLSIKECKESEPINYSILASLPNLHDIVINDCELMYEINGLFSLPNLTTLDLSGSEFYINPKNVILPNTLTNVVLDNITLHDYAYEIVEGGYRYVQKNEIPVDTIMELLTPQ